MTRHDTPSAALEGTAPARSPAGRRVVFLSHAAWLGGAERSLVDLVAALGPAIRPHAVLPSEGPLSQALGEIGCAFTCSPALARIQRSATGPRQLAALCRLWRRTRPLGHLLDELGPDIIHANTSTAALHAFCADPFGRHRLVWHARDVSRSRLVDGVLARRATCTIAISRSVRDGLRVGRRSARVVVIPNGIDTRFFALPPRHEARTGTRVLAIGQLVGWKRFDLLLAVAERLRRSRPGLEVRIVGAAPPGDPDELPRTLQRIIVAKGLGSTVQLVGKRADVREDLAWADVLLHTAFPEPFGRVIIEAMAAGLPVVAVEGAHGPAEIIRDGADGRLVRSDPGELAQVVGELLDDEQTRARLGSCGRETVERRFDRRQMASRCLALYAAAIGDGTSP